MCQAIVKPEGKTIPKATLKNAWQSNQDGAGFCYVNHDNDTVVIRKGFFKFKHFYQAYIKHEHKDVLIHFRYATHGEKVADNCHPFMLAKDAALIHNGILSGFTPTLNSKLSDTRVFCEGYLVPGLHLANIPVHEYLSSKALIGFVESLIGVNNKLAVMTTKGTVIFNEAQGEWYEGVWYSAGYPTLNSIERYNRYWSHTHSSGLQGEDTWLDDMMCGETQGKPLSGKLTWPIDWEEEQEETEQEDPDISCMFCKEDSARMYKIDGLWTCGQCYGEYTT